MIVVRNLAQFRREIRSIDSRTDRNLRAALRQAAEVAKTRARSLASRGPHSTGSLARSIRVSVQRRSVALVSGAPHAKVVELNTNHPVFGNRRVWVRQFPQYPRGYSLQSAPHPRSFMRPAVEQAAPEVARLVESALHDALRGAGSD